MTTRADADGLWVAAHGLDHRAQSIAENRGPTDALPAEQATAAVVSATHTRLEAISSVLSKRIAATAQKLNDAANRYSEADDAASSALAQ